VEQDEGSGVLVELFRLPKLSDWRTTFLGTIAFCALALPFGFLSGLFSWMPEQDVTNVLRVALIAFVLPAFVEEVVFRGPLIWAKQSKGELPILAMVISLIAFVAWHPINTVLFMPQAAELFRDWRFLLIALWLGVIATMVSLRSGSIWTAIIFHWGVVVAWKAFLGAPAFL